MMFLHVDRHPVVQTLSVKSPIFFLLDCFDTLVENNPTEKMFIIHFWYSPPLLCVFNKLSHVVLNTVAVL